jgi:hypothetical protein
MATPEEAELLDILYSSDIAKNMEVYARTIFNMIGRKRRFEALAPLGETPKELVAEAQPALPRLAEESGRMLALTKSLQDTLNRIEVPRRSLLRVEKGIATLQGRGILPEALKPVESWIKDAPTRKFIAGQIGELTKTQTKEWKSTIAAYRGAVKQARDPNPFQGRIDFMGARIFPKEVSQEVQKRVSQQGIPQLRGLEEATGTARTLVAAFDFSAPMIQGLPTLGLRPDIWAKAAAKHFRAFTDKGLRGRFFLEHTDTVRDMVKHGGYLGTHEMYEVAVPGLGKALAPFERSFTSFGDVARVYLWEALAPGATKAGALEDLAHLVNAMTGVTMRRTAGIGPNQSQMESLALFAPRYTRASFELLAEIGRGGWTAKQALKSVAGMAAAANAVYVGAALGMGQEPHLDPRDPDWLTLTVGDDKIRLAAGTYPAMLRAIGQAIGAIEEGGPKAIIHPDYWGENPFWRFAKARESVLASTIASVVKRETYMGRPLETKEDWVAWGVDNFSPIAVGEQLASRIIGERTLGLGGQALAIGGVPAWPRSASELREEVAQEELGKPWHLLEAGEQEALRKQRPEVLELEAEREERRIESRDRLSQVTVRMDELRTGMNERLEEQAQVGSEAAYNVYRSRIKADMGPRLDEWSDEWESEWEKLSPMARQQWEKKQEERKALLDPGGLMEAYYGLDMADFNYDEYTFFSQREEMEERVGKEKLARYRDAQLKRWERDGYSAMAEMERRRDSDIRLLDEKYWGAQEDYLKSMEKGAEYVRVWEAYQRVKGIDKPRATKMRDDNSLIGIIDSVLREFRENVRLRNPEVDEALIRWGYAARLMSEQKAKAPSFGIKTWAPRKW